LDWAYVRGKKVLFLPDQHLGRNTAVLQLGMGLDDCVLYDPHRLDGGLTAEQLRAAKVILWKGHCSVHGRFSPGAVDEVRARIPGVQVLVHPECQHEVVLKADLIGSTEFIIKAVEKAAPGSKWAIGTELNLVKRLASTHPDQEIVFLEQHVCYCATMNRIDLPHLVWALENLASGHVVNQITVDAETERYAKEALQRMLDLPGETARDGDRPGRSSCSVSPHKATDGSTPDEFRPCLSAQGHIRKHSGRIPARSLRTRPQSRGAILLATPARDEFATRRKSLP